MSAIDFYCSVDKIQGVDGKDRVVVTFDGKYLPFSEQVIILFILISKDFTLYLKLIFNTFFEVEVVIVFYARQIELGICKDILI